MAGLVIPLVDWIAFFLGLRESQRRDELLFHSTTYSVQGVPQMDLLLTCPVNRPFLPARNLVAAKQLNQSTAIRPPPPQDRGSEL